MHATLLRSVSKRFFLKPNPISKDLMYLASVDWLGRGKMSFRRMLS